MLTQVYAERYYVTFATSSDSARELMRESFAATDTRLPPLEQARLGASGSAFASLIEQAFRAARLRRRSPHISCRRSPPRDWLR